MQTFGGIDILFANAGIQDFKPLLEMEDADWHDQIDVNLTGTANALRAVAPHIVKRGGGRIILTSSTQGQHGTKFGASYSASKWGILGLMKSAALELGPHGITVNSVVPGLIDTPIYGSGEASEQFKDRLRAGVLFPKRLGTSEEFATLALELLANSYLNAETVRIDGGIRMQPK